MAREILNFEITWGFHGILQLVTRHHGEFRTVLDIGAGAGEHGRFFKLFGKEVYSVDLHESADYVGDFMSCAFDRTFDVVWCSHALEHQRNIGAFLEKIYDVLADDGILAISVPVHTRDKFVSGHITSWNAGLLIYNLVLAGFDCSKAAFAQDYDLCLLVRKRAATGGDIRSPAGYDHVQSLARYFPFPVVDGANAEVRLHDWPTNYTLTSVGRPVRLRFDNKMTGVIEADLD